jgi:hypothetical protein
MEQLESLILQQRVVNVNKRDFFPEGTLENILTEQRIRDCLRLSRVEPHIKDEYLGRVISGGRKILAILILIRRVELLGCFIESANPKVSHIDFRLPFTEEGLREILKDELAAKNFYDYQWETCSPCFSRAQSHQVFYSELYRMPFLNLVDRKEGGFSVVDKVNIHPSHQDFFDPQNKVWKQGIGARIHTHF